MTTQTLDDNARKFICDRLDSEFLKQVNARSYTLTVDWLETGDDNEKKLAYKIFDLGDTQILFISKVTEDGHRTSEKTPLSEAEYNGRLDESILRMVKRRHEFSYVQNELPFSINYDEFLDGSFCMLEVDATNEADRTAFDPNDFPASLQEVTGDQKYYGFRIAETLDLLRQA